MNAQVIPTKFHAAEDYLAVAALPIASRALGLTPTTRRIMDGLAAYGAAQGAMTDYEGGLVRKLPMRAHLISDAVLGVRLLALAGFMRKSPRADRWVLAGFGAVSVITAALTRRRADDRR